MSSWVGDPGRPPYVIPCGSAGLKKKAQELRTDQCPRSHALPKGGGGAAASQAPKQNDPSLPTGTIKALLIGMEGRLSTKMDATNKKVDAMAAKVDQALALAAEPNTAAGRSRAESSGIRRCSA